MISDCNDVRCLNISWIAPFTLDVPGVDHNIWYSVFITNITDDITRGVVSNNCSEIIETYCIFTPDKPSPCHKYTITIVPYNGAGQGDIHPSITASLYGGMYHSKMYIVSNSSGLYIN